VVAIADANLASAGEVAKSYGIQSVFKSHLDIINHPDIEAVVICSPTDTHAKFIIEAAKAGKLGRNVPGYDNS
jgi:myo-inositol 2-dehydrogenase/D-chiro-inositol 1-dehydrogenase